MAFSVCLASLTDNGLFDAISQGSADPTIAEFLQLPLNAPIAHVHRSAVDQNGTIVFIGDGIYRGDVVRLDIKLK